MITINSKNMCIYYNNGRSNLTALKYEKDAESAKFNLLQNGTAVNVFMKERSLKEY